ncbi:MAG: Gfo/Idh/MocA family oxidoreductase [Clostridiales bacterium]|jgi:predicted dehydrogenase|nr:Gfo/Idh/MocA family oxidoreductase [Clostridiales bacterium]
MEKILNIGVIGCGTIANSAHIPNYKKLQEEGKVKVKYLCDIILERAETAVKKWGVGTAVKDYKDVINDPEIDAVSVCTPNKMHRFISIDAMRAGKHVLCEKPIARNYQEALDMQKVQHETGMTLNIGVVNRFNGAVNKIREIIAAGDLGEIYQTNVSFRAHRSIPGLGGDFTTKEIAGGGVLIDWGVHYLDIAMYCLGDPKTKTVSGAAYCKLGADMKNYVYEGMWAEDKKDLNGTYDVDDYVTGFIRTEGSSITFNGAWAQNIGSGSYSYIQFLGTKAGIHLQYGGDFDVYTTKDGKLYSYRPEYSHHDMFYKEISDFVDCVKTGKRLPSHIDTVIVTAKMMQGIYDSSEQNKEIVFED